MMASSSAHGITWTSGRVVDGSTPGFAHTGRGRMRRYSDRDSGSRTGRVRDRLRGRLDGSAACPRPGRRIQAAKAGILEVADIFVVNKADRDGADQLARDLRQMQSLTEKSKDAWRAPVLKTVAARARAYGRC